MTGVEQCIEAADLLSEFWFINFQHQGFSVFRSSYCRTHQTARIVLDRLNLRHVAFQITHALDERNPGDGADVENMRDLRMSRQRCETMMRRGLASPIGGI